MFVHTPKTKEMGTGAVTTHHQNELYSLVAAVAFHNRTHDKFVFLRIVTVARSVSGVMTDHHLRLLNSPCQPALTALKDLLPQLPPFHNVRFRPYSHMFFSITKALTRNLFWQTRFKMYILERRLAEAECIRRSKCYFRYQSTSAFEPRKS
jgi:hypothetical protein